MVSPNANVTVGSNIKIECEYTGIVETSSLVIKWHFWPLGDPAGYTIWLYDGHAMSDNGLGVINTIEKVKTNISEKHAIMLRKATGNVLNNNTLFDIILSILHTLKLT